VAALRSDTSTRFRELLRASYPHTPRVYSLPSIPCSSHLREQLWFAAGTERLQKLQLSLLSPVSFSGLLMTPREL